MLVYQEEKRLLLRAFSWVLAFVLTVLLYYNKAVQKRIYLVIVILVITVFLLFYRLSDLMPFIGDQGWFYMSARDMVLYRQMPLVGITSSHVWLHQGPYW